MKILKLFMVVCMLVVAAPALAVMEIRNQAPLQPLPEGTSPNYSNNVQSGTYLEESKEIQEANDAAQAELDEQYEQEASTEQSGYVGVSDNGLSLYLSILVIVLSAGIAGAYYWYKTRKTATK